MALNPCKQGGEGEVIEKKTDFRFQIRKGQNKQQYGDGRQLAAVHAHLMKPFMPTSGTGKEGQQGGCQANARPAAYRNPQGQGDGKPKQTAAAEEDQAQQR